MKALAQYLAEHLHQEMQERCYVYPDTESMEKLIGQGIEAYESTEGCEVIIEFNPKKETPEDRTRRYAFCTGFAYGSHYGYTGELPKVEVNVDVNSQWFLAEGVYEDIAGTDKLRGVQTETRKESHNGKA